MRKYGKDCSFPQYPAFIQWKSCDFSTNVTKQNLSVSVLTHIKLKKKKYPPTQRLSSQRFLQLSSKIEEKLCFTILPRSSSILKKSYSSNSSSSMVSLKSGSSGSSFRLTSLKVSINSSVTSYKNGLPGASLLPHSLMRFLASSLRTIISQLTPRISSISARVIGCL